MKKTESLRISDTLALPLAYATSRNMVLAQSGAGKSNVCVVLAEEMHRVKIPWIAIDTKGDWYGVRSSRDGKKRGLDVPVFGGEFGDMPLSPLAGARMAELVAAGKLAGVLDVSDFPKPSDVSRFLTDFANTLLKKQRTPIHLFLEECHDYLPQGGYRGQMDPFAAACVGAMKRLATKGRFRGIGYTLVSQRAAEVNKTVLYQCETLIALRMIGDLDIKWIEGWVKRGSQRAPELLNTLHELEDGTCWVWSPSRLKIIERVQARRRATFDSGGAPEIGQARVVPKMAPVEIEKLRKELADLEEQAKADDPKALRARIATLEKSLLDTARLEAQAAVHRKLGEFEVIVDRRHLEETIEASKDFETEITEFESAVSAVRVLSNRTIATLRRARVTGPAALTKRLEKVGPVPKTAPMPAQKERAKSISTRPFPAGAQAPSGEKIPAAERKILTVLAQRGRAIPKPRIAIRAGYSANGGGFNNSLSALRTKGWIEGRGDISITNDGLRVLGPYEPLPEGHELLVHWARELDKAGREILRALDEAGGQALTKEQIAVAAGYAPDGGGFNNALSRLRTLELIEGRGEIRLSEELQ